MSDYPGPERRSDEFAALRTHFDVVIEAQNRRFDEKLQEQREHLDGRLDVLHETVRPVVDVYTTATIGGSFLKWAISILAAIGGVVLAYLGLYHNK